MVKPHSPQVDPEESPQWFSTNTDLDAVFTAWQSATDRLQKTHESLRLEVQRLTDELEFKNRELAHKNRLADLGQMAAHVAHEVRNGLVPLTLYLSLLRRGLQGNESLLEVLDKIEVGFVDAQNTVTDLLQLTGDRHVELHDVNVGSLVKDVCDSLAPQLSAQGVSAELDIPSNASVRADRDMLRRAMLNLVLNAIDVMPGGGDMVVTACSKDNQLEIEVADSGPGIAESARGQVFDPFFTTKREGTGLGLAIVQRIAQAHGGDVDALNCPEGGAAFTLSLPKIQATRVA